MTEREKFVAWAEVELNRYGCHNVSEAAWMECAAQKQSEIDALRKELDCQKSQNNFDATRLMRLCNFCGVSMPESQEEQLQVAGVLIGSCLRELELKFSKLSQELEQTKMHNVRLFDAIKSVLDDEFRSLVIARNAINATSEQIEAYKQEMIAQAKAEQRAKYISVLREAVIALAAVSEIDPSYDRAYRAVDEAIRSNKEQSESVIGKTFRQAIDGEAIRSNKE